jgi:DNA (cytosine-5)-methyltransferase 1
MQTTIFDMLYPKFRITKPIRLIEFFAGYGSQALALKYLGVPFEHWKICEWAVKSIQAYKDIHFTNEKIDLDLLMDKKQMVDFLYKKGISNNYNEPMTRQQIEKLSEEKLENIIKNIFITHNLVNIQQVKGEDLEIIDTDKYDYILTYSFPCQDLSIAGERKGMSDAETRSGLLWEVERILTECEQKPQVLLMENVSQVHGEGNVEDFNKWQLRLEELGYKNYWEDLTATDYEIPQTRTRCFMISILGDYSYSFPPKKQLKLRLKDILESNVDKKYYLSDKMIKFFISNEEKQKEKGNGFRFNISSGDSIAKTITTRAGGRMDDNFVFGNNINEANVIGQIEQWHQRGLVYSENNSMGTICATDYKTPKLVGIDNLKIRKLTPYECFTLMGVKREDYLKVAKNQSDASLYHLAGDSIVVNVLMAIFKEMLGDENANN